MPACVEVRLGGTITPKSTTLLTGAREKEAGRVRERQGEVDNIEREEGGNTIKID